MNIKEIKELIEAFSKNGLTKLELTRGDFSIKLKKEYSQVQSSVNNVVLSEQAVTDEKVKQSEHVENEGGLIYIKSPIIGTFYRAPSPDADPYVEVGSKVKKGDVLCIVEAMKIMNEIESEYNGEIVKIFPKNAEPVEYGQNLFALKPE